MFIPIPEKIRTNAPKSYPKAPRIKNAAFTANVKIIFCQTIRLVLLAIRIAVEIFEGSSAIITISASSIAASDPNRPSDFEGPILNQFQLVIV